MSRNFSVIFTNGVSIGMNMQAAPSKSSLNNYFTWSSIRGSPMCTRHMFFAILHEGLKIKNMFSIKRMPLQVNM